MSHLEESVREEIHGLLAETDLDRKLRAAEELCRRRHRIGQASRRSEGPIQEIRPGRPASWSIVSPRDLRRPKISRPEGRFQFMHAVAHIELSAIELALMAVADFPDLPAAYYREMLDVAADEIAHTAMLRKRLRELGGDLGDAPVHLELWETAIQATDLTERLAVVPRLLEAKGLDVSQKLRDRLVSAGDDESARCLERVYVDEIRHVATGTRWYRWSCERDGLDSEKHFIELLAKWWRGGPVRLDRPGRREAGFTESELDALERSLRSGT